MLETIKTKEQVAALSKDELLKYCEKAMDYLHSVNWNAFNRQSQDFQPDPNFIKLAPAPAPFRSWFEYHLFNKTNLKHAEYEPAAHKVEYTVSHTYQPDAVSNLNSRIFFEARGCFRSLAEPMKYIHIAAQSGITFVFVLQERGIELPWCKTRKDGSVRTIEEWCEVNGFYFFFADTFDKFIRSSAYKRLVATA